MSGSPLRILALAAAFMLAGPAAPMLACGGRKAPAKAACCCCKAPRSGHGSPAAPSGKCLVSSGSRVMAAVPRGDALELESAPAAPAISLAAPAAEAPGFFSVIPDFSPPPSQDAALKAHSGLSPPFPA